MTSPEKVPVTAVVSRLVKQGREAAFEEWLHGITEVSMKFPGHQGVVVLRPSDPSWLEYVLVIHWASYEDLKRWLESEVRAEWLAKCEPLTEDVQMEVETGVESWFRMPGRKRLNAPPRWKMAVVTWLAIYPLVNLISLALGPFLTPWPQLARSAVLASILVPLMTWVVMPAMTRMFRFWLYPQLAIHGPSRPSRREATAR